MVRNIWATAVTKTSIAYGTIVYATLALILLMALMAPPLRAQQPPRDPGPIPPPSQPAPNSPSAPTAPVAPANPAAKVVVNLHAKQARVVFKGHTYNLQQADGSDGERYTDGAAVWRNKDDVGTLERSSKSGGKKSLAAGCHLQSTDTAPATPPPAHH